jgi:hypothetical protein
LRRSEDITGDIGGNQPVGQGIGVIVFRAQLITGPCFRLAGQNLADQMDPKPLLLQVGIKLIVEFLFGLSKIVLQKNMKVNSGIYLLQFPL